MIIATFFGIVLNSIFVVCTEKFLKLDGCEKLAFLLMRRIFYKREMLINALGFLTAIYKIKKINRDKYRYRDRDYKADEHFYWEKQ